ncbi:MAG: NUDIX domain-containing protein [Candidatus Aenigmarchaeota archaeon]|nr:NUDIX domain-containing protein [Candidatus Aenigmarchaeota archaeon]
MDVHQTVGILVRKGGKFLFIERLNAPRKGWWSIPAGHVEEGETPEQAVQREADEEVPGVSVEEYSGFTLSFETEAGERRHSENHIHETHIFFGKPPKVVRTGSDAGDFRWMTPEESLKERITPPVKSIMEWYIGSKRTGNQ